ncbi:MAG TPA: 3-keto-5-aminohexanoate cleavage protein, partial [Kouleothrix sp.]|nr:3-keto-5-aminohexanoate cleavage protein [Kouleothrix sp.]
MDRKHGGAARRPVLELVGAVEHIGAAERGGMLVHRPDMGSLTTGTVNFPTIIYENTPDLIRALAARMLELDIKPEIEVFDLSM